MAIISRLKNAYNAFMERAPTWVKNMGFGSSMKPDRPIMRIYNDRTIITSIYNQIAVDCSELNINHVRLNDDGKFKEIIDSPLNDCLTYKPNIDQTGRGLIIDAVISLLNEGHIAIAPIVTDKDPNETDSYNIYDIRVCKILQWFPDEVVLQAYNDQTGLMEQLTMKKRVAAIIENPFYCIMNEPNSVAQRLSVVLSQLDRTNDRNSSGKMDMIIQLPYTTRTEVTKKYAKERQQDLESQINESTMGIGYIDASEKVIQLNRSIENNLWNQAKDLQQMLFNQLGFSQSIFDGSADEQTMLNYYSRTIEPIMDAIVEGMEKVWISKTARSQKQGIRYFRNPFKLVPIGKIAEMADTFTRNEIMSSNEIRAVIGLKPSDDPKADQLVNANLNQAKEQTQNQNVPESTDDIQNEKGE